MPEQLDIPSDDTTLTDCSSAICMLLKLAKSDYDRKLILDLVNEEYCFACGRKQPPQPFSYCQCTNDE